jgi:ADP-ribose pyrophosphatase YjhB (NUDIX family)/adenylate kinase family enzyme
MNSLKKLEHKIIKSPIGKSFDNNHKQWSSVIVRIRFKTGISRIERPYEYLISKRLNPTGIYKKRGYWNCPGGSRERGETFTQCAVREFRQECGWKNHPKIKYYGEINIIDREHQQRLVKIYTMDIWSEDLIHIKNQEPEKHSPWIHKPLTEIMLLPIIGSLKFYIKKELQIERIPKLIMIEGVDGCGKTTIANEIIEKIGNEKCIFNRQTKTDKYDPFKFKRKDAEYHNYNEAQFRQAVVQALNRRIEFVDGKQPFIIVDKSPYSEILYQKTESFVEYRTKISSEEWKGIEKECLKHKDIIDNAYVMVIQRPCKACFEKYYQREIIKKESTSYPTLNEDRYIDMWNSFYENIPELYKDCKKLEWILSENYDKIGDQINIKEIFEGKISR